MTSCDTTCLPIGQNPMSALDCRVGEMPLAVQMTDADRILIVEDEKILAADLETKLRRLGCRVDSIATSGEEAVRVAQECLPSLVLMDVRLSGTMDGVEAARQIQENTGIPIVYLTAYSDLFLRDPSSMRAPGLCIAKPFLISDLKNVIEIALRRDDRPVEQAALRR
jgi:CheY-like chemotaxis protein